MTDNNPYTDLHPAYNIFINCIKDHMDEVRSGDMHKGQFIGMYNQLIKKSDFPSTQLTNLKYPQFVSPDSDDRSNNWLDFIIGMDDETYNEFKRGLT